MEVETDIDPGRLRRLHPTDNLVEQPRSSEPVELRRRVHLDRRKALLLARLGGLADLVGAITANPRIGADAVAHAAAHHFPCRETVAVALEVPQRLVEPRQRRHQHGTAAIEAAAIGDLPDVLDTVGIVADKAVLERFERAHHRFTMPLEAALAPSNRAVGTFDADEQPARWHEESFDGGDSGCGQASHAASGLACCG